MFAENFHEMLQRDFGHLVLQAIMNSHPEKQSQDKKRPREDTGEEERVTKKQKTEETKPAESAQPETIQTDQTVVEQSSDTKPTEISVPSETKEEAKMTEEHHEPEKKINYSVKFAFEFFDRNRTGYLKSEDLETMFHVLGFYVSKNQMHALLAHQLDAKHRLCYKNLLYTTEPVEDNHEPAHDASEDEQMDLNEQ